VIIAVTVSAAACSILLLAWVVLLLSARGSTRVADWVCGACFLWLGVTSVLTFRCLVVEPPGKRGPLPFFVFLGAPLGLFLAWLSWRLGRERASFAGQR